MTKRLFDLAVSGIALVVLAVPLLFIALLVRLTSPGPVLFRQQRVGQGGQLFSLYKFRTMRAAEGPQVTAADDQRITRVGSLLRRWKLDELPQFWNVFCGQMSVVGPRPEVPRFVAAYTPDQLDVLAQQPGLAGIAQLAFVNESELLRESANAEAAYLEWVMPAKLALDLEYERIRTLRSDLAVLILVGLQMCGFQRQSRALRDRLGQVRPSLTDTAQRAEFLTRPQRRLTVGAVLRTAEWQAPPRIQMLMWQLARRTARLTGNGSVLVRNRRTLVVAIHLAFIVLSSYCAFWLRFDGSIPAVELALFVDLLPTLICIRGLMFVPFRLYSGLWRYTSISDLRNLLAAVACSTVIFYLLVHHALGVLHYPRSIFIIDSLLLMFMLGGVRLIRRVHREVVHPSGRTRVLIFGAGDAGEMTVRDMKRYGDYEPIGFVDDDRMKVGKRIHGIPVLGTRADLSQIMSTHDPAEVLVAIPGAEPVVVRAIVKALQPYKVRITTLPSLRDVLAGKAAVSQIRNLSIEDLLARAPIGLNNTQLRGLIEGRRVLVTGAGGSIGSELCRQIAALQPERLIMYERYENGLYAIANDLNERFDPSVLQCVIGDVTDASRLEDVFAEYQPHVVFHAAAHKHVPLMELNACEAVKNNVIGTRMVAEMAVRFGAERLTLISSDKAVNPSSVMGATKRVAELIVHALAGRTSTRCSVVRFGNVLGSNGSVVPRFLEQIKAGGPVTVTHPDIRRYFMLISEAVQLVLHASALDKPSAVYVLEMGEQIKLLDMARDLIKLSGYVPHEDIAIRIIGLRPGEKLSEELVGRDELAMPSEVEKILRVRPQTLPARETLQREVHLLEELAVINDAPNVIAQLAVLVPTFEAGSHTLAFAQSPRGAKLRMRLRAQRRPYDRRDAQWPDRRLSDRGGGRRLLDTAPSTPARLVRPELAS